MKYRVRKGRSIAYPDGALRGERGYIVDGSAYYERSTLENHADDLEPVERQTPVSSVDITRLASSSLKMVSMPLRSIAPVEAKPKAAKKKASKKKAAKKKVEADGGDE